MLSRLFTWSIKSYFLWNIKKKIRMLAASILSRTLGLSVDIYDLVQK